MGTAVVHSGGANTASHKSTVTMAELHALMFDLLLHPLYSSVSARSGYYPLEKSQEKNFKKSFGLKDDTLMSKIKYSLKMLFLT